LGIQDETKSVATFPSSQWLNSAAFATPVRGQYGPLLRKANVTGPGLIRIDFGVVRVFKIR